jgi:hypothetical protein
LWEKPIEILKGKPQKLIKGSLLFLGNFLFLDSKKSSPLKSYDVIVLNGSISCEI